MMIEENEDIIEGRDRKARNQVFRAIRDGAFDDLNYSDHVNFKPARRAFAFVSALFASNFSLQLKRKTSIKVFLQTYGINGKKTVRRRQRISVCAS